MKTSAFPLFTVQLPTDFGKATEACPGSGLEESSWQAKEGIPHFLPFLLQNDHFLLQEFK